MAHPSRARLPRGIARAVMAAAFVSLSATVAAAQPAPAAPLAAAPRQAYAGPASTAGGLQLRPHQATTPSGVHAPGSAGTAGPPRATTTNPSRQDAVMVVLDVSQSMADSVDKRAKAGTAGSHELKIAAARSAVIDLVTSLPSGSNYGLYAYPTRHVLLPSGCEAGRLITPIGPLNPTRALTDVRSLHPDGGTPTGPALARAADLLTSRGLDGGTIVLVSDGMPNCGPDPCTVAKDLHTKHIDLQVHVVGFDIDPGTDSSLQCIAAATGGQYTPVNDPDALKLALTQSSRPARLTLDVHAPTTTLMPTYAGDGQVVTATVTNTSAKTAADVRARFAVQGNGHSSSVGPPVRHLGNLAPGASRTVTFTVRIAAEAGAAQTWWAAALSPSAPDVRADGTFTIAQSVTPESLTGPLAGAKRVVVLGDSYSSGEGGTDPGQPWEQRRRAYDTGTYGTDAGSNTCHRSKYTYGRAIWGANATVLACSGAVTADLYRSQSSGKSGPPPQMEALRALVKDPARTPDAVLLTFGGNDVGFVDTVTRCTLQPTCRMNVTPHASGTGVYFTYENVTMDAVDALEDRLVDVYADIDRAVNEPAAVNARGGKAIPIVVLPYVRGIPPGSYGDKLPSYCQLGLSGKDLIFLNEFLTRLNSSVLGATTQLRRQGRPVYYAADVEGAFQPSHTICEKSSSYLNYADGPFNIFNEANKELLHPNRAGYTAEAFALAAWSATATAIPATPAKAYERGTDELSTPERALAMAGAPANEAGSITSRTTSGWAAGATVTLVLRSDPRLLGSAVADANGQVTLNGRIPLDVPAGEHHLVLAGFAPDGSPRQISQPVTVHRQGFLLAWAAVAVGICLFAAGLAARRRPPRRL